MKGRVGEVSSASVGGNNKVLQETNIMTGTGRVIGRAIVGGVWGGDKGIS